LKSAARIARKSAACSHSRMGVFVENDEAGVEGSVAGAFTAGHIGIEHALLIAKLGADVQEKALAHCFDGYYAANDSERSLVPANRLQAWIAQNVYLSLKSVPFSKDDETLVPEAGSCANCPKRTGFNTLLFSEAREDS